VKRAAVTSYCHGRKVTRPAAAKTIQANWSRASQSTTTSTIPTLFMMDDVEDGLLVPPMLIDDDIPVDSRKCQLLGPTALVRRHCLSLPCPHYSTDCIVVI
jgi:hypothetical protein